MSTQSLILALALVGASVAGMIYAGPVGLLPLLFLGYAVDRGCDCEGDE